MKKQKRYSVQYAPTGAEKNVVRGIGVFHAVFGTVFALVALFEIIPTFGLFGLIFLAAGLFFAVNGTMIALGKSGLLNRSCDVNIETEERVEPGDMAPVEELHDHIPSTALGPQKRLEQLETLKEAGLLTDEEYREKRKEILKDI